MADDFVKRAFDDARKAYIDTETEIFIQFMEKQGDIAQLAAMKQVGMERIDELLGAVLLCGKAEILADYAQALMLTGFHIGYKTAMEKK